MNKALRTVLVILSALCTGHIWAQERMELSATWSGTVQVPGGYQQIRYELSQEGLTVSGYSFSRTLNGKDSTKIKVSGVIVNGVLTLHSTEFIYKTGIACLSRSELSLTQKDGREYLVGKWKGDFGLSTCPPGASGKIEVERIPPPPQQVVMTTVAPVAESDVEGIALTNELHKRKYYALIIGIEDYSHASITSLDNPVKDAMELSMVLKRYYTFEDENLIVLKNPKRENIIETFDRLAQLITERDQLLIFYAGHGIWDEQLNQGFWLPSDASLNSKAQWLSNSTIRDYIGGIKSKHTLLITDACFSGSILKERGGAFSNSRAILELYKLPSRKAMTSGTMTTVPDESAFIRYLLKHLSLNDQPMISADDLFRAFKIAVINNSPNGQVPQYGPINQAGDEGGEFIFLRRNQ
jgi:hypothetical protein